MRRPPNIDRVCLGLATMTAVAFSSAAPAWSSHDPIEQSLHLGAKLYAEQCAACHGEDLEGQPDRQKPGPDGVLRAPPHDDTGHTWHHSDQLLTDYVTLGGAETMRRLGVTGVSSGMPAFGEILSAAEIDAILDYIESHWSERARAYQTEITRQAGSD